MGAHGTPGHDDAAGRDLAGHVDDVVVPHLEPEERDVWATAFAARAFLLLFALRMQKEERILLPLLEKVGESR